MSNKVKFNLDYYKPALEELWASRCPDLTISKVLGVNNSTVSKLRRSFNIERSNTGSSVKSWTIADVLDVFKKHGCDDFSESKRYVLINSTSEPHKATVPSVVYTKKTMKKLTSNDFFNPLTAADAAEQFIYYNLFAPKVRLVGFLDDFFIRNHKKPFGTAALKEYYSRALVRYEKEHGTPYRFAEPMFTGEKTVSEIFLIHMIIHFAQKAKNKNANPEFINKYCRFIYEVGPVNVAYLEDLYHMLGIEIRYDDFVPDDATFKDMKTALFNKEEVNFVPFPLLFSASESFALPLWAAKKYEAWLMDKVGVKQHIASSIDTRPPVEALTPTKKEKKLASIKESIPDGVEEKPLTIPQEEARSIIIEQEACLDNSCREYPKALLEIINTTICSGNYLTASKLLKLLHAETQGIDYDIVLKGE